MTYQQTLDYIFAKLPMYSRIGNAAFKKDLTNIRTLCNHLGNPEKKFRSIHIGGTNGKGSTSHMLSAILQSSGYKTGLYTSPHLYDFRERIKIDGEMISEDFVVSFVDKIQPLIEEIQPSFFEITVAMAFVYFAEQNVNVAIIEVGLGGRLDSTNIIDPIVSVITNIGWDHMNLLGDTLQQIAFEKGGIIKPTTPVIIGEWKEETAAIFQEIAVQKNAPIYFAKDRFELSHYQLNPALLYVTINDKQSQETKIYHIDLPGIYQTQNILTVLQTIEVLKDKGFTFEKHQIEKALANVKELTGLHGRWEVLQNEPYVVLEVAHNEDGLQQMLAHINTLSYNQLHLVYGMVNDKEVDKVLKLLPKNALYYFTQASIPRALAADELRNAALQYSLEGNSYPEANSALESAIKNATPNDLIIVCGSIFLVAEIDRARFT